MGLTQGTQIGAWVVEAETGDDDLYRCHRVDMPFRKALVRHVRARDDDLLQREAAALVSLAHPNIEGILGVERSGDDWFLLSEAHQGSTLDTFIQAPPLPRRAALDIALQLADALRAAHARGIHHRNLRPHHVLLSQDGRALLTDFNLKSTFDPIDDNDAYVAPESGREQAAPLSVAEQRVDAYAFGVLLYELLTGTRVPACDVGVRTALSLDVEVPDVVRDLVAQLTHPDPEARATIGEAREALGLALRDTMGDTGPDRGAELTYVDDLAEHDERPAPGAIGRYDVLREIGRGGVGVVYEARDPGLQRRVALKVLLAGNFARARDIERFLREARAVAQLDHPHIVRILEFDREDGSAWFAMEFVDGPTLLERIREKGPLPWREAVQIASQLARALAHAHDAGLLHRDVKPNNVLLEDGHRPRLTDFGLAVSTDSADATRLTRTGQVLGTPMYMSPEQARGDLDAMGPPTDVYGIGVVLYEALTGHAPFEGATPVAIIQEVLEGDPVGPRTHDPTIPREVETVCLKAMRRRPRDRYASATELADDLDRCLRGEPILAAPPTVLDNLRWFARRNRAAVLALTAAVLAASAVAMFGVATWQGSERRQEELRQREAADALEALVDRIAQLQQEGRTDDAERAWSTFLEHPDYRTTHALVDGWLLRAAHAATTDDRDARLAALGMAYANAAGPFDQERALMAMGEGLREERELDGLSSVVETIKHRVPERQRTPEVRALQRDASAARRDLPSAAELARDTPLGPVLAALSAATQTEHHTREAIPWIGADAVLALRRGNQRRLTLVGAAPELPAVGEVRLPTGVTDLFPIPGSELAMLAPVAGHGVRRLVLRSGHFVPRESWSPASLYATASGDVDGDGYPEHYLAQGRWLGVLGGGPRFQLGPAHPPSNATNSEFNDLVITDLDGDGDDELVVAAAEWGAYDVRMLGPGRDGLTLEARRKLGVVSDLAVLHGPDGRPTILADKRDAYPNLRVFPSERPTGARAGLWRLTYDGGALLPEHVLDATCTDLTTGDLDGDGIDDAAATCGDDLLVLAQDRNGRLYDVWLQQMSLLAMIDVDDDPAMELVVSDHEGGRVWVLGAGSASPPVLSAHAFPTQPPPEGAPEAFADMWRRAEELATIGRVHQAADAMAQLGDLHWGRDGGREAILRAADLYDAEGQHALAADLYQQAAEGADQVVAVSATRAAARALRKALDPVGEAQLLRTLAMLVPLDDDEAQRLTTLTETEERTSLTIDFTEPLDVGWQVTNPLALRRDPDGGLRLEAFGQSEIARLPVAWDGKPVDLEVDLVIERSEWAGSFELSIEEVGTDERLVGLRVAGRGGGDVVNRQLTCWGAGRSAELTLPTTQDPVTLSAGVSHRRSVTCGATADAWPPLRSVSPRRGRPTEGQAWALVLRSSGNPDTLVSGVLSAVRVRGLSLTAEEASTPADRARRALVDGDPGLATRLATAAPADPVLQVAIAAEADDGAALAAAMGTDPSGEVLDHLMHCRLDALAAELKPLLGRRWPFRFSEAWGTTLWSHGADPEVVRVLLRHLDGLEQVEGTTVEELGTLVVLNARRGAAALHAARIDVAEASLERALSLHEELTARAPALAAPLRRVVASVHLDRAVLAMRAPDGAAPERALEAVRQALRVSPAPEVEADMAAARADLVPLQGQPGWVTWVEPVRAGSGPPR